MYVFLKGMTRLTAVVFEENQLIKLNFFWVIAGEAFQIGRASCRERV